MCNRGNIVKPIRKQMTSYPANHNSEQVYTALKDDARFLLATNVTNCMININKNTCLNS